MTRTLRTSAKRFGVKFCTSIAIFLPFFALSAYLYFNSSNGEERFWGVIGLVLWPAAMVAELLPLLRYKIVIDDQTISGRINKERFSLRWKEVIAVWDSTTQNQPCLNVGARDGKVTIPLKFFDETLLRDLIRLHVAPEAFEKDATRRTPGYHIRDAANERVIGEAADVSLRVGSRFVKGLGWVCGLLFLFFAVLSWLGGAGKVSLLFLIFVALGAYLILASGSMQMNKDRITYITPIGVYRIEWDEVTEVEIDLNGGNLVFIGHNKRLSTLGPAFWSGKDKERMLRLFSAQVETHAIEVKQTQKAMWRLNKNTKVKSRSQ
jgi:hypothetical protein